MAREGQAPLTTVRVSAATAGERRRIASFLAAVAGFAIVESGPADLEVAATEGELVIYREERRAGRLPPGAPGYQLQAAVIAVAAGLTVGAAEIATTRNVTVAREKQANAARVLITAREEEVLELLAAGFGNGEIGRYLGISENTVKFHLSSLYGKLGASGRAEAVRIGITEGYIPI